MIRRVEESDRDIYIEFVSEFYRSDAVLHAIPKENMEKTFDELMRSDMYAEGYIIEADGSAAGYGLIAKTFSQEAGGSVVWVEELYLRPEFRGRGMGRGFFAYIEDVHGGAARFRLEAEPENTGAISLYKRLGYSELGYCQFAKEQN